MATPPPDDRFVLQAEDPVTATVSAEWPVRIADLDRLRAILGPESDGDDELQWTYPGLTPDQMRRIGQLCSPPVVPDGIYTAIERPSSLFAGVPYMIHTGFELPLMLEGRKPLAVFGDGYPSDWFDDYLAPFEPFVADGTLVRRVIDEPMPHLKARRPELDGIRRVFFALPGEEWRIDRYVASIDNRIGDWDDALERLQGELLGYEDWQNDWWIARCVERRAAAPDPAPSDPTPSA